LQFLLLIEIAGERVEFLGPELFVLGDPRGGFLHGLGLQRAADDAPFLGALEQSGVLEHAQVFHETWQRHVVGRRQLGHRTAAVLERCKNLAPRAIGERGKEAVELVV